MAFGDNLPAYLLYQGHLIGRRQSLHPWFWLGLAIRDKTAAPHGWN